MRNLKIFSKRINREGTQQYFTILQRMHKDISKYKNIFHPYFVPTTINYENRTRFVRAKL